MAIDKNVGGGVDRDKLKDSDFVFPAERAFPVVTAGDVSDAVSSWGRYKGKQSFASFKSKLTALAKRKGFSSSLPKKWSDDKLKAATVGLARAYEIELADAVKGGDVIPVMLFPIGTFHSKKYDKTRGPLELDLELAQEVIDHFNAGAAGVEPVMDSSGRHDKGAPAAAWYKKVYLADTTDGGQALVSDAQLTDLGAELLNSGEYAYHSVEIDWINDPDSGERIDNVFLSGTLCNAPVLTMMPKILDTADALKTTKGVSLALCEFADDSYNDLRDSLTAAINDATGGNCWLCDYGPGWCVYEQSSPGGALTAEGSLYHQIAYVQNADGSITLGTPVEVERISSYQPISASDPNPAHTAVTLASRSPDAKRQAKDHRVAEGSVSARKRGAHNMDTSTIAHELKLSNTEDEALVLAEVRKVVKERDELKDKLEVSEAEQRKSAAEVLLAPGLADGHIPAASKDRLLKLAEVDYSLFEAEVKERMAAPATLKLGTLGEGEEQEVLEKNGGVAGKKGDAAKSPTLLLAEKTQARIDAMNLGRRPTSHEIAAAQLAERRADPVLNEAFEEATRTGKA